MGKVNTYKIGDAVEVNFMQFHPVRSASKWRRGTVAALGTDKLTVAFSPLERLEVSRRRVRPAWEVTRG